MFGTGIRPTLYAHTQSYELTKMASFHMINYDGSDKQCNKRKW